MCAVIGEQMTFSSGYVPILSRVCATACFCLSHRVSHCVFTATTHEKPLQTKSEGSDVSPATDQLTEDKHGRRLGFFFKYTSRDTGHTSDR